MELSILKQRTSTDDPKVASLYTDIAMTYKLMNNAKKAIGYWELSIDIYKAQLGPDHPDIARAYEHIGYTYDEKSEYTKALDYYVLSVGILIFLLGEESIDVARLYNNMVSRILHSIVPTLTSYTYTCASYCQILHFVPFYRPFA